MSPYKTRQNYLVRFYQNYLANQDTAEFIRLVAGRYRLAALHRIAVSGDMNARRGAVFAIGFLGNFSSNSVVAQLLRDSDRGVRLIAGESIQNIWLMGGTEPQRRRLLVARRLLAASQFQRAYSVTSALCESAPTFAEAWNERGMANFHLGRWNPALGDCRSAVKKNPFHYLAMVGCGHCCTMMEQPGRALAWYRRALGINPQLEEVRHEVQRLQRLLNQA